MKKTGLSLAFTFFGIFVSAQNFTKEERKLIESGDINMMLRVFQVTEPTELKVLEAKSKVIDVKDPLLSVLINRMLLTLKNPEHVGVGIAAPQVGINRNIIWVQRFDKQGEPLEVYINPKIVWRSVLLRKGKEGCLSIPKLRGDVLRNYTIKLDYLDKEGKQKEEMIEGFTAVIFQHEVDHLNGILFTDRLKEQEEEVYYSVNEEINLFLEKRLERQ